MPTVGLNIETIIHKDYEFTLWDVGGSKQAAKLWKHYFDSIDGVFFCVDIGDRTRLQTARDMLVRVNKEDTMKDVPFLVFLNKTDLAPENKMDE